MILQSFKLNGESSLELYAGGIVHMDTPSQSWQLYLKAFERRYCADKLLRNEGTVAYHTAIVTLATFSEGGVLKYMDYCAEVS